MKRLVLFFSLGLVAAGCSKGHFTDRTSVRKGVFTYALNNNIVTLDPGKVQDVDMGDVLQNVFEGLVAYGEDNKIQPRLATSWDVKNGGKTYVFHLRPGVTFHNGRPLTASDFKWTWERNLSASIGSPVAGDYLANIVGVKEFTKGAAKEISGLKVVDDATFQVTIDKPRPYFLGNLTYPCSFVVAKEAAGMKPIEQAAQAVGTGPFTISQIVPDQELDLAAYPKYYEGPAPITKIRRPIIKDPATRLNKFRGGELDFLTIGRSDIPSIEANPALKPQLHFEPRPAIYYLALNQTTYAPFKDIRVRKAVAFAINRPHIVGDLLSIHQEAFGFLPPGVPGYRADYRGLGYNVEEAKKLLADAGYPGGKGLPTLELAYREGTEDARVACEAIATALQQNVGIPIQPHAYEWAALLAMRNKGEHQTAFMSWYADYLDPQNFLSLLLESHSSQNHDGYSDPRFDALCDVADLEQDNDKRMALYQKAESLLVEEAVRVPLYFQRDPVLVSPHVKGIATNLFGQMPHRKVSVGG